MTKKQRIQELERRVAHLEACLMYPKASPYPNHVDRPWLSPITTTNVPPMTSLAP